jgi:nucleotide-binding universal stress UspA family protein
MEARILVPLDGSTAAEAAVPFALSLLPGGGEVVLVRVAAATDLFPDDPASADPDPDALGRAVRANLARQLDAVVNRHGMPGVRWTTVVADGDPAEAIVRAAVERGAAVIAMATHGRGAVGRAVFGSVADRVARSSPLPVLLVRSGGGEPPLPGPLRRLVVPLDGSALAEAALPVAAALAGRLGVPIHLLRVATWDASLVAPAVPFAPVVPLPPEVFVQAHDADRAEAARYLAREADRLRAAGSRASWTVLDGSPFAALAEAAAAGDLIVLTSHGRGGVLRWALGSVAEKLVREAPAPVLLIPAAGRAAASPRGAAAEPARV